MTHIERRQHLMAYITGAPDKKVDALYTLLEEEITQKTFTLTEQHLHILEEREAEYVSGKTRPASWEEVHDRIRNKNKGAQ
jgi:carbonic anhydrase